MGADVGNPEQGYDISQLETLENPAAPQIFADGFRLASMPGLRLADGDSS
jgi:hypothetical protein